MLETYSSATMDRCHFAGNRASGDGGAIFIKRKSLISVENSLFTENFAGSGASVAVYDSEATIKDCNFLHEQSFQ